MAHAEDKCDLAKANATASVAEGGRLRPVLCGGRQAQGLLDLHGYSRTSFPAGCGDAAVGLPSGATVPWAEPLHRSVGACCVEQALA